ncbi:hypothetical protein D2962_09715 [Biomaibacter acetigenes]|uniref:Uncharacterized protein n=1 Tax=Biomaibacter acetigenes TaxID=2316383 RepID=A0A3G2R630_9FIRM|nr:hypothetical protein D2962_09715 [Biomaibacter acetigenes]
MAGCIGINFRDTVSSRKRSPARAFLELKKVHPRNKKIGKPEAQINAITAWRSRTGVLKRRIKGAECCERQISQYSLVGVGCGCDDSISDATGLSDAWVAFWAPAVVNGKR